MLLSVLQTHSACLLFLHARILRMFIGLKHVYLILQVQLLKKEIPPEAGAPPPAEDAPKEYFLPGMCVQL
jgi:hypothetical protein